MVISIASQKGGTGKTSTALAIAAGLANLTYSVLLIDMDSQANASKVFIEGDVNELKPEETIYNTIINRQEIPIYPSKIDRLHISPAHIYLNETDLKLSSAQDHREARLAIQLEKIKALYEFVIIDCPPALGWLSLNAFTASDELIIPISPGYFSIDSITQINKVIEEVQKEFNPRLKLKGYLFNMADNTSTSKASLRLLRENYGDKVFKVFINKNTDVNKAQFNKQDIFSYNPLCIAAKDYQRLIKEILL